MEATDIICEAIWEDADATNMARVLVDGDNAEQDDIASITRTIYDLTSDTPTTAIDTTALTVASVMFDTLQTDSRWSKDDTGYNFRDTIDGAEFPTGNHIYGVKYWFTGAGGATFPVQFELTAQKLYGS